MNRQAALPYVSHRITDSYPPRDQDETTIPDNARLVGWQCGHEPLFVAVWDSVTGNRVEASDAEDAAREYLLARNWFADAANPPDADHII